MVHEAAHVSLDDRVEPDPEWLAAQKADGAYITPYAQDYPQREDVAESFMAYLAVRFRSSRISEAWKTTILDTIPNRIAYFDALLSADDMKPFASILAARGARGERGEKPGDAFGERQWRHLRGRCGADDHGDAGDGERDGRGARHPGAGACGRHDGDRRRRLYPCRHDLHCRRRQQRHGLCGRGREDEPDETVVVELGSPLGPCGGRDDHVTIGSPMTTR